jgi:hypothetical protein
MVAVLFVRSGTLHHVKVQVSTHADELPQISGPVIGIRYEPVGNVSYVETSVVKVDRDVAKTGLVAGDVIERVGDRTSLRAIDLVRAAATPEGVRTLEVRRNGGTATLQIGR